MNSPSFLSDQQIKSIKRRLWLGERRDFLASEFGCSQVLIREISRGVRRADVQWPNGSTGAMPKARERQIVLAKRQAVIDMQKMTQNRVRVLLSLND